ncbi:MAG: hypothetical protein H7Z41_08790 [Cytophagales bacterium]|nr:hypothetical protein [Armatimonadota bacterium]
MSATETTNKDINGIVLASSVASIATAIYLYAKGQKDAGIFVGLWAPTILGLGSFINANRAASAESTASTTP